MEVAKLITWRRDALLDSPFHLSVAREIARLPAARFPTLADLNALAADAGGIESGGGAPIRFRAPDRGTLARYYETEVFASGGVPTRADNWHDLFNALVWIAFPRTKRAINAAHVAEIERRGNRKVRGPARDALSLFDEGGILVACADPSLAELLAAHAWRELFCDRRADVRARMAFYVFGHAVLEKALSPYPSVTGKALVIPVDQAFFGAESAERIAILDHAGAAFFRASGETAGLTPRTLGPLPILGVPGWDPANESPAYYDDTRVFRPARTV